MLEILEASPEQPAQQLRPHILPTSGPVRATAVPQLRHPEPEPLTGFFKREQPSKPVKTASALGHRSIALSIAVDADARRISQALTEPEYLEAWISLPDHAEDSQIVASKRADGYRLDQVRAGRSVASFVGSFLFCHQRKMRLSWHHVAGPEITQSLVDFRIRGNFASSVLELRHTSLPSAREFLWYRQLWGGSLARLAKILHSA